MKNILLSFLLIFNGITSLLAAGEEYSFSLREAMDFAVSNNTEVHNARLDVEAARKRIWENASLGLPQVSAAVDYTDNLNLMTTLIPAEFIGGDAGEKVPVRFGTQHNSSASLNASQLVFNGPYLVGLQAANVYKKLTEQNLERTEQDIRELVAQTYYLILMADETILTLQANLENLKKSLYETREMYKAGLLEETDVDQLRIAVTSLNNSIKSMQRQKALSLNMLSYQLGLPVDASLNITDNLQQIVEQAQMDAILLQELDVNNNINFRIMSTRERLAYLNMKRIRYEYIPSLDAFYLNTRNALRDEFNFFDFSREWYQSSLIGLSINIPIFSSGNRRARISQGRIEWEKAKNTKEYVARGLELEFVQARYDFTTALEKYLNEKENILLSQKIADRTTVKYNEGVVSSLQLTQANDQLLGSQANYVSALVDLLNAKIRLDKVLNQL